MKMGSKIWQKVTAFTIFELIQGTILVRLFHCLSVTLLSLLLPLSFLLLAKFSSSHYFLSLIPNPPPKSQLLPLLLYTNPNLLHVFVSFISIAALINTLTGHFRPLNDLPGPIFRPRLHGAWIFLCTLQVCVGLGIEATVNEGMVGLRFGNDRSILSKLIFFLGLHETMVHWCRTIVRPVVDDTVYGGAQEERWAERWALAVSFSALSWWRLRDEVDSLVLAGEGKRDMNMKVGVGDVIGWWLYYLTVAIGMAWIFKGMVWIVTVCVCRKEAEEEEEEEEDYCDVIDVEENGYKV